MIKQVINIKKLDAKAQIPSRGSKWAAGYDLYAILPEHLLTIPPHETMKIHTGIAVEIPNGYFGAIFARSGLATKRGLRPANCVGCVDADYRGEVIVALHNDADTPRSIEDGERVAQIVVMPFVECSFNEVDDLEDTARGEGGFGHSGRK